MSLDILYCAYNRLDFTKRTFHWMTEHTDWSKVDRLVVYDDGSRRPARQWLQNACSEFRGCLVDFRPREGKRWGSPVAVMLDYLNNDPAEWFAKIDNDIALPHDWLTRLLWVRDDHPDIDLLGMEAGMTCPPDPILPMGIQLSSHIGGIGLMRSNVFNKPLMKLSANGRHFGFTEWQHHHRSVQRGWITPDLPCPLLDRLPFDPYLEWSKRYHGMGWQRRWPTYHPEWMEWAFGWVKAADAEGVFA